MQKSTLIKLDKQLTKIEKDLVRLSNFQEKGYAVKSTLNEIYHKLRNIGDYLNNFKDENNQVIPELSEINYRYKKLVVEFENIADETNIPQPGMVMSSNKRLPEFIKRLTKRNPKWWKFYEGIAATTGILMIAFSLIGLTYFLIVGHVPSINIAEGIAPSIKGIAVLIGIIIGLVVHELAHAIVLANNDIGINEIGLIAGSIVGGFVEADEETFFAADDLVRLRFNAASIGTNALLAVILIVIGYILSSQLLIYIAIGNFIFGFINSFPISPLDGGWVYEDLVKMYIDNDLIKKLALSGRFVLLIIWTLLFVRLALL
ncbi:MAG: hypothetical protein GX333_00170 [Syntrophomonadaceae bacterium]|nr:hypothetical protein [Syntrophomonadaceae bacterium]